MTQSKLYTPKPKISDNKKNNLKKGRTQHIRTSSIEEQVNEINNSM